MTTADDVFRQALDHHRAGRLEEASRLYLELLKANPEEADAVYLLGVIAHQSGLHEQTVDRMRQALAMAPDQARCYNVMGLGLRGLGRAAEAEASFERAIHLDQSAESSNNLGILLTEQGRLDEAIAAYGRALERTPDDAVAHYNLGNAYLRKQELVEAAAWFRRAIDLDAECASALAGLGRVLKAMGREEGAIPFLERAASLEAEDVEVQCDLGDALQTLGRFQNASAAYGRALERNPKFVRAWYSAGCAENSRGEYASASVCFRRTLETHPDWPQAQHNLGQVLFKLGQVDEAVDLFRRAASSGDPELPCSALATVIPASPGADNATILEARRAWAERYLPAPRPAARFADRARPTGRMRVGYVSSFFQNRNWMKPVWGLINHHDEQRFEVHLFSDGPADAIQHGYEGTGHFHDISGLSNEAAADRIEAAGIDLLVDLNGYSAMRRLPLFALRPAPAIAGWFNMFATTGMACYDFLIGDAEVIPREEEEFYCEKIARVEGSYLTFEVNYPVPDVSGPPCAGGRAFTFGCLAPLYKINAAVVDAWSRILREAPDSVLMLKNAQLGSDGVKELVHGWFAERGIAAGRIRLEGPSDHYQFLKAYDGIDVALDTFPYNGGTTTTEAMWQGVPVVTFWGDRWVSRTSASILRAGGMGGFVAAGVEEYVAMAVRLAGAADRLEELRGGMRERLRESPVCDTKGFARRMEEIYWAIAQH